MFVYEIKKENNNNNDNDSIKDEQVRNDIRVLSSRLYDLRERFMKIVHKINKDAKESADQISEEGKNKENILFILFIVVFFADDTTDEESGRNFILKLNEKY